jgi:drug/metabolite transporter (DMT)-like permease
LELWLIFLSVTAAVLFALGLVLTQFGLRTLPPLVGGSYSVPTSFALFAVLAPVTIDFSLWDWRAVAIFAGAGVVYPAVVSLINFYSNREIGPNLTGGLGNLAPIFAIGLAVVLLGELPSVPQWAGIFAVCAGLVLLALDRVRRNPAGRLAFLLVPIFGAFFRGAVQPIVKIGYLFWPSAFAAALFGYLTSAVVIWIARAISGQKRPPQSRAGVLWFMAIGLCNGTGLLALYVALQHGEVVQVSPIVATYPLITILLNRVVHGDRSMGPRGILGSLISVAGVVAVILG